MKKFLSLIMFTLILFCTFSISVTAIADEDFILTTEIKTNLCKTVNGQIEQIIITLPKKYGDNTYSYVLGSNVNKKNEPVYIINIASIDYNTLIISPIDWNIKERETKSKSFAVGIYNYNRDSRDLSLTGAFVYNVNVQNVNGVLKVSNITSDMTKQKAFISDGDNIENRYKNEVFTYMKRNVGMTDNVCVENFQQINEKINDDELQEFFNNYGIERYYHIQANFHVHEYQTDGKCKFCCDELNDYSSSIPTVFLANECPLSGNVDSIDYKGNNFVVYTPYGYNENDEYDVVFLAHGGGGGNVQYSWLVNSQSIMSHGKSYSTTGKNLIDWMIYRGSMNPTIFVAAKYNYSDGWAALSKKIYNKDENNKTDKTSILPYVINHYGTYARSDNYDDIIASRKHFGICGTSSGAAFSLNAGFRKDGPYLAELFGTKIILSGHSDGKIIAQWYMDSGHCEDSIYFTSGGKDDQCHSAMEAFPAAFEETFGKGSRTMERFHYKLYSSGHNWTTFFSGFMWAMSTSFR